MTREIREGDCIAVMAAMPEASVAAVVCDPPYGLGFMGHAWDQPDRTSPASRRRGHRSSARSSFSGVNGGDGYGPSPAMEAGRYDLSASANRAFQAWCEAWAREAYRVLQPGGYLLAFGGTRTYHRMASGVEDAGFEVRDQLQWLYGSGFPKSLDVEKAGGGEEWAGWGTALKPAHEPIVMARKPLAGTVAANVLAHGTGAINVDACRIEFAGDADEAESKEKNRHADFGSGPRGNTVLNSHDVARGDQGNYDAAGRWPANVLLDEAAAAMLDEQTGPGWAQTRTANEFQRRPNDGRTAYGAMQGARSRDYNEPGASGVSRFFYCAKAGTEERSAGLGEKNTHPTVKPIALMRWLVRLVTPPGGLVLDPFAGSGTTGIACALERFAFVGLERQGPEWVKAHPDDDDYCAIAEARIAWWERHPEGVELVKALEADRARRVVAGSGQLGMFGA